VDLDRILQSIHEYFEELGMAEIRRRQVACMLSVKSAFGSLSSTLLWHVFYGLLVMSANVLFGSGMKCIGPLCS
jgi:hypothetical protein